MMNINAKALTMDEFENIWAGSTYTAGSNYYNSAMSCPSHHHNMYFTGKMWERPLFGLIDFWTEHINQYYCPDCGNTFDIAENKYNKKPGEKF